MINNFVKIEGGVPPPPLISPMRPGIGLPPPLPPETTLDLFRSHSSRKNIFIIFIENNYR